MARYVPEKHLSLIAAGALAVGCTVGWGAFILPGTTFLPKAGPIGTAIALVLAAALMFIIAVSYRYLTRKLPYDGGSFYFANEAFGRLHSYACGWSLVIAYLVIIPTNATALSELAQAMGFTFLQEGPRFLVAGFESYLFEIIVAAALLGALALVAAHAGKRAFQIEMVLVACMAAGLTIIAIVAIVSSGGILAHLEPAFHPDADPLIGIIGITAIAPWIFIGFGSVSQMAGEFTFEPRKAGALVFLALALAAITYIAMNAIATITPAEYGDWVEYLGASASLPGTGSYPVFSAMEQLMGPAGKVVMGITMLAAIASGILGFYLVASRLLVAMARRGVLSDWFGELSWPRRRPLHAILFLFIASLVMVCFGRTILNWLVSMSSVGATIAFLYTCAAARKLAREDGAKGVVVAATTGMAACIVFLILLIIPIPQLGIALDQQSYLFVIAWVALAFNFYTPDVPHFDPEHEQIALPDYLPANSRNEP